MFTYLNSIGNYTDVKNTYLKSNHALKYTFEHIIRNMLENYKLTEYSCQYNDNNKILFF